MNSLEKRNEITNKIKTLKEALKKIDFSKKIELLEELIKLEDELRKNDISNESDNCEIC